MRNDHSDPFFLLDYLGSVITSTGGAQDDVRVRIQIRITINHKKCKLAQFPLKKYNFII
jgi:hypothetical protein